MSNKRGLATSVPAGFEQMDADMPANVIPMRKAA
jgi:hypothetical protein